MIEFEYLSRGLNAMARAHHMSSMAGHLGAAVIAGYFVGEQRPDLEPEVYDGIRNDLGRVIQGESAFGRKMSKKAKFDDSELFEPFPEETPDEGLIDGIAEALEKNVAQTRQSGHNVIFASIALRALRTHPELATPSVVNGIRKLVSLFDGTHPGTGYYGKERGRLSGDRVTLPDDDETPAYDDLEGMADAVLGELLAQDANMHRQGYGGIVHVNNHAAAIVELANQGYAGLVPRAIASHHQHLRLWRNLPNLVDEFGPMPVSRHSPWTAAYWESEELPYDRALLTHRVKTRYGFDELVEVIEDRPRETLASESLLYLM